MNKKYYDCFSLGLMMHFRENGVDPVKVRMHHKTNNTIWVFKMTEKLDILLEEWRLKRNVV